MTTRRQVFALCGAMATAAMLPAGFVAARPHLPYIYGDGVNDDTEGLQAWLDGRNFASHLQFTRGPGRDFYFPSGEYRLARPLHLAAGTRLHGQGSAMHTPPRDVASIVGGHCVISDFFFLGGLRFVV